MFPGTWAQKTPDKPALVIAETGQTTTYAELDQRSLRLAHVFADAGLRVGDVVAMVSDNAPEAYEVYWAALRSGLYITAVNHHLSATEAAYIVNDCGAKTMVVSAAKADLVAQLQDLVDVPVRLAFGGEVPGCTSYDEALAAASTEPLADQPHGDDFLYSSGTTGRPKGIKLPLPEIAVDEPGYPYVMIFGALLSYGQDTVYLSPAPVYHAAPLRYTGVIQALGGTVVLMQRFEPEAFLRAVQEYSVTDTQCVPTMFVRMLKLPEELRASYDTSSLKTVVHAAAPCPVEVKQQTMDWLGPIVHEYYASTEANGATYVGPDDWLAHPGTVGRSLLGTPRICDPEGKEMSAGEVGTIYFERDDEPFTYHFDADRTAATRHPEHPFWSTVGDLGYLDDEGYLYLTDRKAFMIISGGVNIYPQEAENVLIGHPKVVDVAVFGVPNADFGEEVKAVVQPASMDDAKPELEQELIAFCRSQLADVKCPRTVDFREELPRHPTGKLYKRLLKDEYWQGHGQSRII